LGLGGTLSIVDSHNQSEIRYGGGFKMKLWELGYYVDVDVCKCEMKECADL
jgi:hypothetical protein